MCEGVLAAVEERAKGRPVDAFTVRAGALLRIVPEAFSQAFAMVAAGTVAEAATPQVVIVPVRGTCADCDLEFSSDDPPLVCPTCGSMRVSPDGGDGLVLEAIRYRPTTAART